MSSSGPSTTAPSAPEMTGSPGPHPPHRNSQPPQYKSDYNDYPQDDNSNYYPPPPPPRPQRGSSQSGIFFTHAHHFDINGGEFLYANTVNKNETIDSSYKSNFDNTRNDDYRGSSSYARNFNGAYNDNRQFRSQRYDARYNAQYSLYDNQEEDEGEDDDGDGYGYGYGPNYGHGRGYSRRGYGPSRRGGRPGPRERLQPRQQNTWDDLSEPEHVRPATTTPPMLESRQAVRQREREQNAFDRTYFDEQSSSAGPQYGNQSQTRNRGMMYQEEPQSYYPDPDLVSGVATPRTRAVKNPFRAASAPVPGPSASRRGGSSFYTPYDTSTGGSGRRPSPLQEPDAEVEGDVEMGGVDAVNTEGGREGGVPPDSGLGRPSRAQSSFQWTN